jgi:DNA modification methylase
MDKCRLFLGDCLDVLATLPAESVDAVVTDPPAGIGFMGKAWDTPGSFVACSPEHNPSDEFARVPTRRAERARVVQTLSPRRAERAAFLDFLTPRLAECLRVAQPGARLLCWAIPRTSHWTGLAIEDAGWIIEDRLAHVTGQGFPKAKSKLKPAVEDWWLARKPGGKVPDLNIEACRVEMKAGDQKGEFGQQCQGLGTASTQGGVYDGRFRRVDHDQTTGRYPPNLLLSHHADCRPVGTKQIKSNARPNLWGKFYETSSPLPMNRDGQKKDLRPFTVFGTPDGLETVTAWRCVEGCPVRALDAMSGERKSGSGKRRPHERKPGTVYNLAKSGVGADDYERDGDSGGASRFYPQFTPADDLDFPGLYCPKASQADRGEGNTHPTVKPQMLMRWLCRLICPPGGTVIDPFLGSGTTGLACLAEGLDFLGIESDPEWFAVAERRIAVAERRIAAQRASTPLLA